MLICFADTVNALGFDPTVNNRLFALLARDPYMEVQYIPAEYVERTLAIDSVPHREVVVTEGDKTTRLPLELTGTTNSIPSPRLLAERPGKVRKPVPVHSEE